jgi:hypothetical protein
VKTSVKTIIDAVQFLCCKLRAIPYSRASLLNKSPYTRRVSWLDLLAGASTPTLFTFRALFSLTRAFVASHKPQNILLPNLYMRVARYLNEQHTGPGVYNDLGDPHAVAIYQ